VDYVLAHGADIVVNTDGDNQYPQDRIGGLVKPIIAGEADIVIADRQTQTIAHFSASKKLMQRFGSHVVNRAASTELPDAASGFRAYSRASLLRLNVLTQFSYCMETIVQAGNKRLRNGSVAVVTNAKSRESRLFKNTAHHMVMSATAIMRSYLMFKPYVIFATLTAMFGPAGGDPIRAVPGPVDCGRRGRRPCPVAHLRLDHVRGRPALPSARGHLRPAAHQPHSPGRAA